MARKGYERLREEAEERYEASREGKPEARRGRSRQRPDTNKVRASVPAHNRKDKNYGN